MLHVARAFRELSARRALHDDCVHINLGDHQAGEHLLGRNIGVSGHADHGGLALPLSFKILLAAIHSPILAAHVAQKNNSDGDECPGQYSAIDDRTHPGGEQFGLLGNPRISIKDRHRLIRCAIRLLGLQGQHLNGFTAIMRLVRGSATSLGH